MGGSESQTPNLDKVEKKLEEELRKEEMVSKEGVEAKAELAKARIGRDLMNEVEDLARYAEEKSRALEQYRDLVEEEGRDMELLTGKLFGGLDRETVRELMKRLGESDNPTSAIIALSILSDMQQRSLLTQMMMMDFMDERRMRRMMMYRQLGLSPYGAPVPSKRRSRTEKLLKELKETMDRLLTNLGELMSRASTPQQQTTLKDVVDAVKGLIEMVRPNSGSNDRTLKVVMRGLKSISKSLEEAIKELRSGKSPDEALQIVKNTLNMVRDVVESVRGIMPNPTTVVTTSPLQYSGQAPWYFHPDARAALKDLVDSIGKTVTNVLVAWKSAGRVPMAQQTSSTSSVDLPKELSL